MPFRTHDSISEQNRRRARDQESDPPQEPMYSSGNATYICTLPPGSYEIESDDDAEFVRINRVDDDGTRECVAALPRGPSYSAETDENGFHIYAKEAGEPDRQPLSEDSRPVNVGLNNRAHFDALKRANQRNHERYGRAADGFGIDTALPKRAMNTIPSPGSSARGLAAINEANAKFGGGK
jgi:hypothetical protein